MKLSSVDRFKCSNKCSKNIHYRAMRVPNFCAQQLKIFHSDSQNWRQKLLSLLLHELNARWCQRYILRNESILSCPWPICRGCRYLRCTNPLGRPSIFCSVFLFCYAEKFTHKQIADLGQTWKELGWISEKLLESSAKWAPSTKLKT